MSGRRPALQRPLSDRDLAILETVDRFRVMSGDQLRRWHFPVVEHGSAAGALRRCQRVLKRLADNGVLATLDRRIGGARAGSAGYCYVLGYRGQRLFRPSRRARSAYSLGDRFIAHTLAMAEVATQLIETQRSGAVGSLNIETEPDCWRHYVATTGTAQILKPDLFTAIGVGDSELCWFVEVDRDTESLLRIENKCRQYLAYLHSGIEQQRHGVFPKVLWTVPHERRLDQLRGVRARLPPPAGRLFAVCLHDHTTSYLKGGNT